MIKKFKIFENSKNLEDYKLTKSLYKFDMQRYYDRLNNSNMWELFEQMENYLQEYIDEDRIICFITTFKNIKNNYDIRLSWNISHKELTTIDAIKDKSDILNKLTDILKISNLRKFNVLDGNLSGREFVVLNIDLSWEE